MFSSCYSLSSLPDISKWNTTHLEDNDNMFERCDKLVNKPTIEKKRKDFLKNYLINNILNKNKLI